MTTTTTTTRGSESKHLFDRKIEPALELAIWHLASASSVSILALSLEFWSFGHKSWELWLVFIWHGARWPE